MKTFVDSTCRTWTISLTVDTLKRVKSLLSVDLTRPDDGDPPLHVRMFDDVCLLADVVFAAVKPQADAAGVTDEVFGQSLGGGAITAAAQAFLEEWTDFFRSRQRTDLVAMIQKYQTLMDRGVRAVEAEVATLDVEAAVDQAVQQAGAKARAALADLEPALPETTAQVPLPETPAVVPTKVEPEPAVETPPPAPAETPAVPEPAEAVDTPAPTPDVTPTATEPDVAVETPAETTPSTPGDSSGSSPESSASIPVPAPSAS
jgi:outer membrane biosynthesis protein TonB